MNDLRERDDPFLEAKRMFLIRWHVQDGDSPWFFRNRLAVLHSTPFYSFLMYSGALLGPSDTHDTGRCCTNKFIWALAYPGDCSKCCLSIHHTYRWMLPLVMSQTQREGLILKWLVMANNTHTWWYNRGPLNTDITKLCVRIAGSSCVPWLPIAQHHPAPESNQPDSARWGCLNQLSSTHTPRTCWPIVFKPFQKGDMKAGV